jgi:beta-glucosidase
MFNNLTDNAINGVPACANAWLINETMRGAWGWEGAVVSDENAVRQVYGCDSHGVNITHSPTCFNYTHSASAAAVAALTAGVDVDYGGTYQGNVPDAVATGSITMAQVRGAVRNMLRLRLRTGEFDAPSLSPNGSAPWSGIGFDAVDSVANRQLARRAAGRSLVLVQNRHAVLPLPATATTVGGGGGGGASTVRTVAVIGEHTGRDEWEGPLTNGCFYPNASAPEQCKPFWEVVPAEVLGGAYRGTPSRIDTLRTCLADAFEAAAAAAPGTAAIQVVRAAGVDTGNHDSPSSHPPPDQRRVRIAEAAAAAAAADVVVVTLTGVAAAESLDRETLTLPAPQAEMLSAVAAAAAGKPVVCVLVGDGSLSDGAIWRDCDAVLLAWMGGQGGGYAVAQALLGLQGYAPSGALPVTIYSPSFTERSDFTSMSLRDPPGRGARFLAEPPAFPFGHSLSYTTWAASVLDVNPSEPVPAAGEVITFHVRVNVTNTGQGHGVFSAPGDRVVLLSMRRVGGAPPAWPLRWLVAFGRAEAVLPGASVVVSLSFTAQDAWRQWDTVGRASAGQYELLLGTDETPAAVITVMS